MKSNILMLILGSILCILTFSLNTFEYHISCASASNSYTIIIGSFSSMFIPNLIIGFLIIGYEICAIKDKLEKEK